MAADYSCAKASLRCMSRTFNTSVWFAKGFMSIYEYLCMIVEGVLDLSRE